MPFQDLVLMTNSKLLPPEEVSHNQMLVMRFMHRKQKVKNTNSVSFIKSQETCDIQVKTEHAFKPLYYVDEDIEDVDR